MIVSSGLPKLWVYLTELLGEFFSNVGGGITETKLLWKQFGNLLSVLFDRQLLLA